MEKEIKLPKVAEGVESATVSDILVKEGDAVTKGQSVIVVESDKASVEVPSEEAGKVKTISVKKDADIKPGDVILILETEEKEEPPKEAEKEKEEKPQEKKTDDKEKQPQEKEEVKAAAKEKKPAETEKEEKPEVKEEAKEEVKEKPASEMAALPNALRLARELGIDINDVKGSGAQGKILEEDVTAYAREIIQGSLKGAGAEEPLPDFSRWGEVEKMPLKSIRKATAKRTATTWRIIPHVTHFDEAEISKMEELRTGKNHLVEKKGGKLTLTAILLKIVAEALKAFPKFNASIDIKKEEIILKKYIHIGVAVDTERGLLVPVVRDVDKKDLIDLSVELTELSEKTRSGKLSAEEMNGGSFVISNVGGIGGTNFTQLVYHPQVAILGVAKAVTKAVFIDNEFKPKHMLPLSLSYDHRIIDGADAARFLRWICEVIENPLNLF